MPITRHFFENAQWHLERPFSGVTPPDGWFPFATPNPLKRNGTAVALEIQEW
jgi:hypothetical protein